MSMTSTKSIMFQALTLLGVVFLIVGAMMVLQNRKEASYQPVEGLIKEAELKKRISTRSGEKTSSWGWELYVTYEYVFDGQIYESNNVSSKLPTSDASLDKSPSKKLLALADRLKTGKTVTVYVSSKHPHRSILLHTKNYGLGLLAISGLLFALAFYLARR